MFHRIVISFVLFSSVARAEDGPKRVSVAPWNDLSAVTYAVPRGAGFGSSICGYNFSEKFVQGYGIGTTNDHFGKRDLLVIDDGKSIFALTDRETGLPLIVLTDAKITQEFQDLVKGYNAAMKRALEQRKKLAEQASGGQGESQR